MGDQELVSKFKELLQEYEQGRCTRAELIGQSMELLGAGNAELWDNFPEWVRTEVEASVFYYTEDDDFLSFSGRNSADVKREILSCQRWLRERKRRT